MTEPKFLDRIVQSWTPEFVVPSGSYLLDNSTALKSFAGIPSGTIIQLMSRTEGSYKTSFALQGLSNIQALGYKVAFVDAEAALMDVTWAEGMGIDSTQWSLAIPESGEEACEMVEYFLEKGYKGIVVDSIDAMQPSSILTAQYGDASIGNHAKLITAFVRRLKNLVVKHNAIVYLINQMKINMTQMGARGHKATGGSALGFYSKLNIEMVRGGDTSLKDKDLIPITLSVKRSKLGDSFLDIDTFAKPGVGIYAAGELAMIAQQKGLVKKAGSWWKTVEGETIGQGPEALAEWCSNYEFKNGGIISERRVNKEVTEDGTT